MSSGTQINEDDFKAVVEQFTKRIKKIDKEL